MHDKTPTARPLLLAAAVSLAMASGAIAASPAATSATRQGCFDTFQSWFDSSASACPLSADGLTVYGVIDVGYGYETHGAPFNGDSKTGVSELIAKGNNGARWQGVPSGLGQSNIGIRIKEQLAANWYLVGDVNAGFDPYSLHFANGPKSLVDNNNLPLALQSSNTDSARSTGWDNSRAYLGVSNATFGTLSAGRQTSLSNDLISQYDPLGGAYAFSLIGNSSTIVAGTGDTETSTYNMSIKYQVAHEGLRAAALVQLGGYAQRNNAQSAYQLNVGGDVSGLSVDAVYAYAKDAVALSNFTSGAPTPDTLKATLANVSAGVVTAKYKWRAFTLSGGYENARLSSPSDLHGATATANGQTLTLNGGYPAVIQANIYVNPKDMQVLWFGGKYSLRPNLDLNAGYYYTWQNNFTNAATKYNIGGSSTKAGIGCGPNLNPAIPGSTPQGANAAACSGNEVVVSGELDWRPVKRIDLYSGVMFSKVEGGLANGFIQNSNTAFTSGVRFAF